MADSTQSILAQGVSGAGENSTSPAQTYQAGQDAIQRAFRAREAANAAAGEAAFQAARQAGIRNNVVFGNASGPQVFRPGKTGKGKGK